MSYVRRITTLGLIIIVLLMVGCSSTESTEPVAEPAEAIVEEAEEPAVEEAESVEEAEEPAAEEVVEEAEEPSAEQIELSVMLPTNELSDEQMAEFEAANPDIKLIRVENDVTVLNAMLAAGTPPDIIRASAFEIPRYVQQGILLDITSYLEQSDMIELEDIAPAANYFVIDGASYGLPKDWSPDFSLFFSNNALDEAGLDVPSATEPMTFAELADIARQLTVKEGDRTLQFGFIFDQMERQVQYFLAQTGGSLYSEDYTEINLTNNPEAEEILRTFHDLAVEDVIPNPLNPAASWPGEVFMNGNAAIVSYGYWFSGMVNGATEESPVYEAVTMVPSPVWEEGLPRYNPTWGPAGTTIATASPNPDAAFRFFEWYNAGDPAVGRASSGWGVPALHSLESLMPVETPFQQAAFEHVQNELPVADYVIPINPYYQTSVFDSAWSTYLEDVLRGTLTFEEMLELMEAEINAAIRDGVIESEAQ